MAQIGMEFHAKPRRGNGTQIIWIICFADEPICFTDEAICKADRLVYVANFVVKSVSAVISEICV